MIFSKRTYLFISIALVFFLFLKLKEKPRVVGFELINAEKSTILWANTDSAITQGIIIPDSKQIPQGKLVFRFTTFNLTGQELYYKIYYSNTTYGFNEKDFDKWNDLLSENFYGSWNDFEGGFKPIGNKLVSNIYDSLQIVGNPLDEEKYFGASYSEFVVNSQRIEGMINYILTMPDWVSAIKQKAIENKVDYKTQLLKDALWALRSKRNRGAINHRWKRNPRTGKYKFLLVVCTKENLKNIPVEIQDVRLKNKEGKYINPFFYFLKQEGKFLSNKTIVELDDAINVKAKLDISKGIYVDFADFPGAINDSCFIGNCGNQASIFRNAHFEQFFHSENTNFKLKTIPLIKDVQADEFSVSDYLLAKETFKNKARVEHFIGNTNCPCKTVRVDTNFIEIKNPGNSSIQHARKENVGIKTRVGFTYGKITALVEFPHLLNKSGLWNGITNAVWLLFQDRADWNNRRWSNSGYMKKGEENPNAPRVNSTYYSEIDFEMIKTSQYWPATSYKGKKPPFEDASKNKNIIIATTNWDLANKDPKYFFNGVQEIKYNNQTFFPHRWTDWYQAVTNRYPIADEELFNGPTFYQIEWKPNEIIWRIGKNKENLKTVGYINEQFSNIPNNQMILVVTQEFHLAEWWPPVVFEQDYIPFPKSDLKGKIISVEVE